jgi:5-methylcytosine-specific restriction protein A
MSITDEKQELLIKRIKSVKSREWINSYFDMVKRILDITHLTNDDPRLAMSLSPNEGWRFPISINNRYVIAFHIEIENGQRNYVVGTIFCHLINQVPHYQNNFIIRKEWQFKNLRGEYTEPPYFLRFENASELSNLLESSEQVIQCWIDALFSEINRAKSSTYRKSHEPMMYKMAMNVNFRAEMLDMAFSETKPKNGLLPDQIDEPWQYYEGALHSIVVNAYERNPLARQICIEQHGIKCSVCGFNFQEKYGDIGENFIHIHHIKPLSEIYAEYIVDPINDLCPVCPNCHAMLHMRKPPYSIDELRTMLKTQELKEIEKV